jgi:hypothetical protein
MEKIKIVHDQVGKTLTIWLGDPKSEHICEETTDEVVLMKDAKGRIIGLEILGYEAGGDQSSVIVETILKTGTHA